MYYIVNPNTLYDMVNELRIELQLLKGKENYDIADFLDNVSIWMDSNRGKIGEVYLPFSVLSVGMVPVQVSAFMYGLFVGKAIEKHGLKILPKLQKIDKEEILKEIQKNIDYYNGIRRYDLKNKYKEFGGDNGKTKDTGK
jgi:hypothetical protein